VLIVLQAVVVFLLSVNQPDSAKIQNIFIKSYIHKCLWWKKNN